MTTAFVLAFVLALQAAQPAATPPNTKPAKSAASVSDSENLREKLKSIRRIYVDSFGEEAVARQIQAMVVSSLAEAKRFIITENKEKADAFLRGTALEKTSQEFHSNREATAAAGAGGTRAGFGAAGMAVDDTSASTETIDHARVAVRLVSSDGDVIWASTQESRGAKYKGASADVADKIVKQLMRDVEKLDRNSGATGEKP